MKELLFRIRYIYNCRPKASRLVTRHVAPYRLISRTVGSGRLPRRCDSYLLVMRVGIRGERSELEEHTSSGCNRRGFFTS